MRKLVIKTLDVACNLFFLFWVILGFFIPFALSDDIGLVILGGLTGFITASISIGFIFILLDVRSNLIQINEKLSGQTKGEKPSG